MRLLSLLLVFFVQSLANTQVSDISFNQQNDKIEVILQVDNYDKSPKSSIDSSYKGLILPNLQALSQNQTFNTNFIKEIQIFNIESSLYVLGVGEVEKIDLKVSKTSKHLKITFSYIEPPKSHLDLLLESKTSIKPSQELDITQNAVQTPTPTSTAQNPTQIQQPNFTINLKEDFGIETWRYAAVLCVMAGLVIVLFVVKNYVSKNAKNINFANKLKEEHIIDLKNIKIIAKYDLDYQNYAIIAESNGYRYIILNINNNISLLDRYPIPQDISQKEKAQLEDIFSHLLEHKQERLSRFLHNDK